MARATSSPRFRVAAGRLCRACCGGALAAWAGAVAAAELRPAGPELTLTLPDRSAALVYRHALTLPPGLQWGGMVSPGDGRVQLTLQRYQRAWQPGGMSQPDAVALGVYLNTGPRAQLGWQSRPFGAGEAASPWQEAARATQGAMSLRAADPLADLRLGALARFSLGQQTSLSLRPRKGGLRLYLQAQW